MSSISEIYRVRQRAIEYAIKHNNNSKAAVKYKTSRQQIKRWRDRYDGTSPVPSAKKQKTQKPSKPAYAGRNRSSYEKIQKIWL